MPPDDPREAERPPPGDLREAERSSPPGDLTLRRQTQPRRWRLPVLLGVAALVLAGAIYAGIRSRAETETELALTTDEAAVPTVNVIHPTPGAPDEALVLPGNTQAFRDTAIYARTNGYLKRWYFDIGAHVKRGDLLAEIDTPEVDAQLRQARADLATAEANLKLAEITAVRNENLLKTRSVSTQDRDNAVGAMNSDRAIVQSREANVKQLEELQSFERVEAPFDGIVTARNVDIGALIAAGGAAPARELFHLAAIDTLRVYVEVPESYVPSIHVGLTAAVTADEYPGQSFQGTLVRTADAIDLASRTLLVEVDVPNPTEKLLPGAYVNVHFRLPAAGHSVTIPSNTLLFRKEGLQAGVVRDGKVQLVPVKIGQDYGDIVEVIEGLTVQDQVVLDPSDSLESGTAVHVHSGKNTKAAP
ncbi:MAG TPA: efflux RND transporter periplasmic adaptor subunit [Stellaceae bacterium]|nr:efflux RND transporter periplasmic adaptor subunit [Stellaceae bacterium]